MMVIFFIGIGAAAYALMERFNQTNERRVQQRQINERLAALAAQSRADNRKQDKALERLLCFARTQTDTADIPVEQKVRALDFYDNAFKLLEIDQPCQDEGR